MTLLRSFDEFRETARAAALAAGFFDGVHTGHQRILAGAARRPQSFALTFTQHPSLLLTPANPCKILTPLDVRLELLAATGITGCLLLDFTPELASLSPREFVSRLGPNVRSFHCGENWRFGKGGAGTPAFLKGAGFEVETLPPALWRGEPVSSTRVRAAVCEGALDAAERMLGRPWFIRETAQPGRAVGRTLGVPTLNFHPRSEIMPPVGVYAVRVRFAGERAWRGGVANYGFRPTFPDRPEAPVLEVHFFDAPGRETNGLVADTAFVRRLRGERVFESPAALAAQLRADRAQAAEALR